MRPSEDSISALAGWVRSGNITTARGQVTRCDPIWYTSSCSSVAGCKLLYSIYLLTDIINGPLTLINITQKSVCPNFVNYTSGHIDVEDAR